MNSFSIDRFGKALRWVVSINRARLLGLSVGVTVAILLLELITAYIRDTPFDFLRNISGFIIVAISLMILVFVSSMFSNFTSIASKQQRSAFLTLPATNLEKFLAVVVYVTVICSVCAFVGIIIGDSLRMACMGLVKGFDASGNNSITVEGWTWYWWSSAIPQVLHELMPNALQPDDSIYHYTLSYRVMNSVVYFVFLVWIHSLYTLGGTLLRKYPLVVSSIAFFLCMLLFMQFTMHFELTMFRSEWRDNAYVSQEVGTMAYVLVAVLPLLSCLNYWASFHIFKHFELISNKWTNYDLFKR